MTRKRCIKKVEVPLLLNNVQGTRILLQRHSNILFSILYYYYLYLSKNTFWERNYMPY